MGSKCRMEEEEVSGTLSNSNYILTLYRNPTLPSKNVLQGIGPGNGREDCGFRNQGSHGCSECPVLPEYLLRCAH